MSFLYLLEAWITINFKTQNVYYLICGYEIITVFNRLNNNMNANNNRIIHTLKSNNHVPYYIDANVINNHMH